MSPRLRRRLRRRPRRRPRRRCSSERGSVSVLVTGFAVVAVLLVVVVVDASAAFLSRQRLDALADGAALAAADAVAEAALYQGGVGERVVLDPVHARQGASAYLVATGARRQHPGLEHRVVVGVDTVAVHLSTPLDLPLVPPGWVEGVRVRGSAEAVVTVLR